MSRYSKLVSSNMARYWKLFPLELKINGKSFFFSSPSKWKFQIFYVSFNHGFRKIFPLTNVLIVFEGMRKKYRNKSAS